MGEPEYLAMLEDVSTRAGTQMTSQDVSMAWALCRYRGTYFHLVLNNDVIYVTGMSWQSSQMSLLISVHGVHSFLSKTLKSWSS